MSHRRSSSYSYATPPLRRAAAATACSYSSMSSRPSSNIHRSTLILSAFEAARVRHLNWSYDTWVLGQPSRGQKKGRGRKGGYMCRLNKQQLTVATIWNICLTAACAEMEVLILKDPASAKAAPATALLYCIGEEERLLAGCKVPPCLAGQILSNRLIH